MSFNLRLFRGSLISAQFEVDFPNKYLELASRYTGDAKKQQIIYLPLAKTLYFYEYDWGYFGASFLPYIFEGDTLSNGPLDYFYHKSALEKELKKFNNCELDKSKKKLYIWDSSLENSELPKCFEGIDRPANLLILK